MTEENSIPPVAPKSIDSFKKPDRTAILANSKSGRSDLSSDLATSLETPGEGLQKEEIKHFENLVSKIEKKVI